MCIVALCSSSQALKYFLCVYIYTYSAWSCMHVGEQTRTRPYDCRGILGIVCCSGTFSTMKTCARAGMLCCLFWNIYVMKTCGRASVPLCVRASARNMCGYTRRDTSVNQNLVYLLVGYVCMPTCFFLIPLLRFSCGYDCEGSLST